MDGKKDNKKVNSQPKKFGNASILLGIMLGMGIGLLCGYYFGYLNGATDTMEYLSSFVDKIEIDQTTINLNQTRLEETVREIILEAVDKAQAQASQGLK